jgi:Co/Zn/Cd efflux system component
LRHLRKSHGSILWIALILNLAMFFVEMIYGWIAHSSALTADSLDMLGDAFVYAMSLYALDRSQKWVGWISLTKGMMMGFFGVFIFGQCVWRFFYPDTPNAETMGIVSSLALIANLICAVILLKHRNDDLNMRSTWLCSRNDVLTNLGTLIAALIVAKTGTHYADVTVGTIIAFLVLQSSWQITRESIQLLQTKA